MDDAWRTTETEDESEVDLDTDLDPDLDFDDDDFDGNGGETNWQRVGAACGIASVVAILASVFVVAQPPKADASAAKILTYYVEHRRMLLFSQWLAGLGAALFLWFAASLRAAWVRSDESAEELSAVAFAGGVALGAGILAATGINLTLAYLARQIQNSPDLIRTLYAAQFLTFTILFFAAAVFLAGGGLLIRRLGARWLGLFGLALAVYEVFAAGAISSFRGLRSPTGPLTLIAFFGLLAWILLTSLTLFRRLGRREELVSLD